MKKINLLILAGATMFFTGCKDFLDINEDPNQALSSTPQNVLAAALTTSAANLNGGTTTDGAGFTADFNSYGAWVAGYWGKSGEVNGYAEERTYNYTTNFYQGLWASVYDNQGDFNYVQTKGVELSMPNHTAIAMIMKAFNYQMLVDQYGDIPYEDALKGTEMLTPHYTPAQTIYKDLVVQLDAAIKMIKDAPATSTKVGVEDIVFAGKMTNWIKFANTLKLRILMRQSEVDAAYVTAEMAKVSIADGFIAADVLANPAYTVSAGKQNPFWERYNKTAADAASTQSGYVRATQYAIDQYDHLSDKRITKLYNAISGSYHGVELGEENAEAASALSTFGTGLFKSATQSTSLMLAAESYFLQAEAKSRGFLAGGDVAAKADFVNGITASYVSLGLTAADATLYLTTNVTVNLVDYDASTNKKEAIIFQKWLALNSTHSNEAWSEYRRTGFPSDMKASLQSISTRADKLPVRLLYPTTEIATNSSNVPKVNQFTNRIFWDIN